MAGPRGTWGLYISMMKWHDKLTAGTSKAGLQDLCMVSYSLWAV